MIELCCIYLLVVPPRVELGSSHSKCDALTTGRRDHRRDTVVCIAHLTCARLQLFSLWIRTTNNELLSVSLNCVTHDGFEPRSQPLRRLRLFCTVLTTGPKLPACQDLESSQPQEISIGTCATLSSEGG